MKLDYNLNGFGTFHENNIIGCLKCVRNGLHRSKLLLGELKIDDAHDISIINIKVKEKIDLSDAELTEFNTYIQSLPKWDKTSHYVVNTIE